jgi:S-disulfanyl-L-cysteine oxidoreductase SoxD
MRKLTGAFLAMVVVAATATLANDASSGIGRAPSSEELAARTISVAPDGTGLPVARGSAREGRTLYNAQCAGCHGTRGEGIGDNPPLVGGRETLTTEQPLYTVGSYWPYATTVWDYINRAMPYQAAGTLKADEVYAVTAYVLFLNGIVRESQVLDAKSLPRVRMPYRDGFVDDPRPDAALPNVVPGSPTFTKASTP